MDWVTNKPSAKLDSFSVSFQSSAIRIHYSLDFQSFRFRKIEQGVAIVAIYSLGFDCLKSIRQDKIRILTELRQLKAV